MNFRPYTRLPGQLTGAGQRSLTAFRGLGAPAGPSPRQAQAFAQALADTLLTRQDRLQTLGNRRQEFPRVQSLRSGGDAHLSRLLLRTALGHGQRRGAAPAQPTPCSPRTEVERHFQAGASGSRSSPRNPSAYDQLIQEAAQRHRVPEDLVKAVIKVESNFNPRATSPKGAMGLMQLMPGTARGLGVSQAYDPKQNIDGGTRYLRELLDRYQGNVPMALAAYNWGPGNLEKGRALPSETRHYLEAVGRYYPLRPGAKATDSKTPPPPRPARPPLTTGISVRT